MSDTREAYKGTLREEARIKQINFNENEENNKNQEEGEEQKPVVSVIIFDMPILNASIIKDFVSDGVIYNQTLGLYSGHKGIDFSAEEGTQVLACYDGVIESITTSKLDGTTITINHGDGLKSIYNSVEVSEDLFEGATISKGEVIGTVSNNNRTEYKDGAHLHFEVVKDNEKIDPNKYLLTEEK